MENHGKPHEGLKPATELVVTCLSRQCCESISAVKHV